MRGIFTILWIALAGCISCEYKPQAKGDDATGETGYMVIVEEDYELYKPSRGAEAVLILFGGYPEVAADIKREFDILNIAEENHIAVLLSNFNRKLWLEAGEKDALATHLQSVIEEHQLPKDRIFIGGFSSGGVVSLLLSNFIVGSESFAINPKGVFIVDSPIDLAALYASSEKNIERDFSATAIQESTFLLKMLGDALGNPEEDIQNYEAYSVFTFRTGHTSNLQHLKNTDLRLYTEPDTLWWRENRRADYQQMNAFYIEKLAERLQAQGFQQVEYIPTKNKGYRANGDRHPHSWSIVDKKDLIRWILRE
ncbi:MAG: hypothetical protein AAFQ83_21785 [Bacteroidota bacterium]